MVLSSGDLTELYKLAQHGAIEAGKAVESLVGPSQELFYKEGQPSLASQVLTKADLASQDILLKILEPSLEKFQLGMLSEELPQDTSRFERDYFWAMDPLDGTLAYSRDLWGYSISLALLSKDGTPLFGVVYDPRRKKLYHGPPLESRLPSLSSFSADSPFYWLMDESLEEHGDFQAMKDRMVVMAGELGFPNVTMEKQAGAALKGCSLLERPGVYVKFPRIQPGGGSIWDFAATSYILNSRGGKALDFHGSSLELNRKESSYMNHRGILFCSRPGWWNVLHTGLQEFFRMDQAKHIP